MPYKSFIDEEEIDTAVKQIPDKKKIRDIIAKCKSPAHKGLTLDEVGVLLNLEDAELLEEIFETARQIKQFIYGNRMVLFAPLYVSNTCANNCLYCGFRKDNKELIRRHLTKLQLQEETEILQRQGHKRLLLVYGETPYKPEQLVEDVETCYAVKTPPSGEIRRINMNIAPMSVEDFKILSSAHIGTFQCFQETYHRPTYEKVHVSGKKADYLWRLFAHHRSYEGGIEDYGMGVLYGLYDYKYDTIALIKHAQVMEETYGVGPHTVSFPRLEPAHGSDMAFHPPYKVSDDELKKIVVVTRLALPYVGMIISTREKAALRMELLKLGISQLSAGSKVSPGGYHEAASDDFNRAQFDVADERSLDEVIYDLVQNLKYMPSFCTGCYRKNRVGEHFMGLAKKAFIKDFCFPNAVFTFSEYLRDYASEKTKKAGLDLVREMIESSSQKEKIEQQLTKVAAGANDIYF